MSSPVWSVSIGAFIESPNGSEWWPGKELAVTNEYVWDRLGVVTHGVVAGQRIRRDQRGRDQRELGVVAWQRTSRNQRGRDQRGRWSLKEGRMLRTQFPHWL